MKLNINNLILWISTEKVRRQHVFAACCYILFNILATSCSVKTAGDKQEICITSISLDTSRLSRYSRSFLSSEGDLYIDSTQVARLEDDGTVSAVKCNRTVFPSAAAEAGGLNSYYSRPGLFISLGYRILYNTDTGYVNKLWISHDDLKTVAVTKTVVSLPDAGIVDYGTNGQWAGLFCHRGIIQINDGTLLAAVYGNFESDSIIPENPQSRLETKFKLRAFVIVSADTGKSWSYRSSVAVPAPGKGDDSEGFNEWTMAQLNDGRILAIIRTGHFTPPVVCTSKDAGKIWSSPVVIPELGPAMCDPCLIKLSDGRLALSYGEMVQPEGDREQFFRNFTAGDHPRRCRLAITTGPDASEWDVFNITGYGNRSAYSSTYEVKTNVLLYQTGKELYKIDLIQEK